MFKQYKKTLFCLMKKILNGISRHLYIYKKLPHFFSTFTKFSLIYNNICTMHKNTFGHFKVIRLARLSTGD